MDIQSLIAPEHYNIAQEIETHFSDKKALILRDEEGNQKTVTYAELIRYANKLANAFSKLGIQKGDRVLIMTTKIFESYSIYLACLKSGIIMIPCSEMLRAKDLVYRVNHSKAKAVIVYHAFVNEFNKMETSPSLQYKIAFGKEVEGWLSMEKMALPESDEFKITATQKDDYALFSYTSGTTGQPKAVVHSHGWGYAHIRSAASLWLNIGKEDIVWATAAPGWQKWVWTPFLSILGSGATGFVYNGRFNPEKYLELLEEQKINVLCCTPTEYRMMAKLDDLSRYNLSHLHSAVSAGEALNREVIDVFKNQFNFIIRDGYGQTESTLLIGNLKGMELRLGSMGKAIIPGTVQIVDNEGNPVKSGVVGNIAVRRDFPALFKLYYKDAEKTAKAMRGEFYLTGDRASQDEDGYFWFQGRSDDVIISSGYTIGPFEVEDALMKHPSVKECAVVASPDEIRGNVVKAFIVLKDENESSQELVKSLQAFVKSMTAPYKYPRLIDFVKDLPKTDSGKIRRVALREAELRK
ncbi:acyl-CoA synthetase MbcS [Heyndrickxia acidicola]|uniref:Acyl--CoA ligase n=1 Tax=Heyndrickxia acidicola TaxID=209389 RepID=A0ABU6MNH6_9BACI|nr:acyl--CoA ligase [Heyndrickxia acidicola]MED1205536.1 acyl--CoA ligase [Heyndrickxia acidicola]